jgi:hypothetical protein
VRKRPKEREKTCLDCGAYLPASEGELTEFGICIKDEVFEPIIEELLDGSSFDSCRALVEEKKFVGEDRSACPDFEQSEHIEIDDDSPLGQELHRLAESRELTPEAFEAAVLDERLRQIDWKAVPVDEYATRLQSKNPRERKSAIPSLGALIAHGNSAAFNVLLGFLKDLSPPETINEVHLRREILRHLTSTNDKAAVASCLIKELYRTASNNTTRQWISDIFRFLKSCPLEAIREPLERMLSDNRFSYRLKKKIKEILLWAHSDWHGL